MNFNYEPVRSVSFGVCLDTGGGESYRIVPCDQAVQDALKEMLTATLSSLSNNEGELEVFSPAEKYGTNERLQLSLESELSRKHSEIFSTENFETDTHGLDNPGDLIFYYAIFHDAANQKLMAFRRATQFKGVLCKRMLSIVNDALRMIPETVFRLDNDFDFVIYDNKIYIWRPSGFIFTANMDNQLAECAGLIICSIGEEIECVDFSNLVEYVANHKLAMRLVAAIRSRRDLNAITLPNLKNECEKSGIEFVSDNGKLKPTNGNELAFLMLLDRRRYALTLVEQQPEVYEASSRHAATTRNQ